MFSVVRLLHRKERPLPPVPKCDHKVEDYTDFGVTSTDKTWVVLWITVAILVSIGVMAASGVATFAAMKNQGLIDDRPTIIQNDQRGQ